MVFNGEESEASDGKRTIWNHSQTSWAVGCVFFLWDTHHYEVKLTPDTSRSKVHFWPIKSGPNWGSTTKSIRAVDVCRCLQQKLHNTWDPEFSEIIPDHP
jgi:hypothetical protein